MQDLRDRMIAVLKTSDAIFDRELREDTSLIKSGRLDSPDLFTLARFIEGEVGREMDFTQFEIAEEWDTITNILKFVARRKGSR